MKIRFHAVYKNLIRNLSNFFYSSCINSLLSIVYQGHGGAWVLRGRSRGIIPVTQEQGSLRAELVGTDTNVTILLGYLRKYNKQKLIPLLMTCVLGNIPEELLVPACLLEENPSLNPWLYLPISNIKISLDVNKEILQWYVWVKC